METVNIFLAYSQGAQILSIYNSMLKPYDIMIVELSSYFSKEDFSRAEFFTNIEIDFIEEKMVINKGTKNEYKNNIGNSALFDIDCTDKDCINYVNNKKQEGLNDLYYNVSIKIKHISVIIVLLSYYI